MGLGSSPFYFMMSRNARPHRGQISVARKKKGIGAPQVRNTAFKFRIGISEF